MVSLLTSSQRGGSRGRGPRERRGAGSSGGSRRPERNDYPRDGVRKVFGHKRKRMVLG